MLMVLEIQPAIEIKFGPKKKTVWGKYEGKSLNNRNFIITFLQEYLQKLFGSYFLT